MVAAALLSVPIAYVYAELSSAFPIAGGEYCMVGRAVGPGSGFAVLGLTVAGNMLAPAVLALGASEYIAVVIPGLNQTAVAIAIIAVTTLLGILHVRTNAWVTGIFLLLELLALAVLVGLGFWNAHNSLWDIVANPVVVHDGALQATPLAMIGLATTVAIFAYNGYGAAVYFAEEMHEARRGVARTVLWALVITVITELLPVTAVLVGAPDLKALLASQNPFQRFCRRHRRTHSHHRHQPERGAGHPQRRAGVPAAECAVLLQHRPRFILAPAHQRSLHGHA